MLQKCKWFAHVPFEHVVVEVNVQMSEHITKIWTITLRQHLFALLNALLSWVPYSTGHCASNQVRCGPTCLSALGVLASIDEVTVLSCWPGNT